jgi:hypothetical protein
LILMALASAKASESDHGHDHSEVAFWDLFYRTLPPHRELCILNLAVLRSMVADPWSGLEPSR